MVEHVPWHGHLRLRASAGECKGCPAVNTKPVKTGEKAAQ